MRFDCSRLYDIQISSPIIIHGWTPPNSQGRSPYPSASPADSKIPKLTKHSFGPPITALHVLMMYATAGNLDTYLLTRSHSPNPAGPTDLSAGHIADADSLGQLPKEERIKAFKKRRQSSISQGQGQGQVPGLRRKREENRGVLMLGLEEIGKLFGDVVEGLAFLVGLMLSHDHL